MADKGVNEINGWFYTLVRVIFFYACTVVVFIFADIFTKSAKGDIAGHLSMFIAAILTFFLVLVFTRWEQLNLNDVGVVPGKRSASRFSMGFVIGLSIAVVQAMIVLSFGHLQLNLVSEISISAMLSPLLLYIFAGFREELVFRSYSLRSLGYSLTPFLSLSIVTTLFVAEHLVAGYTWQNGIIGAGTGAILFGLAAIKTKGLALPLGLHIAFNFGQWTLGFKGVPGLWKTIVEDGYESQVQNIGMAAYLFAMGLAIAAICVFYNKERIL